jgi:hypothetical protein
MTMCGCGGVTPLILKLGQIRKISALTPGRFTLGEVVPFFLIFIEYDAGCGPEGVLNAEQKTFARTRVKTLSTPQS